MRQRLFLVDAYALIFRSYYAFISRPMRNSAGLNTSAIFGFTKFIKEIIAREKPHYIGVAFDPKGGNFRHELYPQYKANRTETPEDIILAVPYIKRILEGMRIPILEIPGYEADDVIGTLAKKGAKEGFDVFMVTPDKDFGQLVDDNIFIYKQLKGGDGVEVLGKDDVMKSYGISSPDHVVDILAIWGDAADNIPGVPGIGEKGASKLVSQWGTIENILDNIESLKPKQKESILANAEQLKLSKVLATIDIDVPIEFRPEELIFEPHDEDILKEVYQELNFSMFLKALGVDQPSTPAPKPIQEVVSVGQGSLFDGFATAPVETAQNDLFSSSQYATIETTPHKYHIVNDESAIKELVDRMKKSEIICFDTETSGFDMFCDKLIGIAFCMEEFEAYYLPLGDGDRAERLEMLREVFEDEKIAKIGQNIKFDTLFLRTNGVEVKGRKYDTMILHYLLDPESRHNMNALANRYLNYQPIAIERLIGSGKNQLTMDRVALEQIGKYAAEDADVTMRLYNTLWPMVIGQSLAELYLKIEEPLIDVLAEIELEGVKIDSDILNNYGKELTEKLNLIEQQIRVIADEPHININSARQLGEILFGKLKIDEKPKMTKTKQYSTDEEYLQSLSDKHEIVGMILEYRGLKKLLSTYVEALPLLINRKTGRVHTSFNQAVTATGRLSSTNPNLQNIPIRDSAGREIRKAFVPRDEEHLLLSVDYSQVELRIMAHLSDDEALISAFQKGEDIHSATAALLYHKQIDQVTSEERRKAKTANFGIIYGISAFGLSQRLNIPRYEAKEIIDGYFESYKGVKNYMETVVAEAREHGYVTTIFGRKRYLADIRSSNANVRGLAERNAINAPIQGSAADIMKLAMIAVHKEFVAQRLHSKIILQVHDELVIDMLGSEKDQVLKIVVEAMETVANLKVTLTAEYGIGKNWLEAH